MTSPRLPIAAETAAAAVSEIQSPEPIEAGAQDVQSEGAAAAADGASQGVRDRASAGPNDAAEDPEAEAERPAEDTEATAEEPAENTEAKPDEQLGNQDEAEDAPPLPSEAIPDGPPLPEEPAPEPVDDGWEAQLEPYSGRWYFANRFTGVTQWENPRVPEAASVAAEVVAPVAPPAPANERPAAGGYNPAVHGDYDPNAWYAQAYNQEQEAQEAAAAAVLHPAAAAFGATVGFNAHNGQFQDPGAAVPNRHSDEAKSHRQMNAFFDVDAAANSHDGRSLKAERQNQRLSKTELKAYKEKRRAKKEEKRRAWLMD